MKYYYLKIFFTRQKKKQKKKQAISALCQLTVCFEFQSRSEKRKVTMSYRSAIFIKCIGREHI